MRRSEVIARRYARAYFELAKDRGDVGAWREQLARAVAVVSSPDVLRVLRLPTLGLRRRVELALALLEGIEAPARNLVRLLVEHGRVGIAGAVLEEFDRLADRASGVVRAEVTTAVELDDELRRRLESQLYQQLGAGVQTTVRVDPAILGGLVVRVGDRVIDASVRTRLRRLQAVLS